MRLLPFLALFSGLLAPQISFAQAKQKCPRYIADLETGEVVKRKGKFKCFRTKKKAENKGFVYKSNDDKTAITFAGATNTSTENFYIAKAPTKFQYRYSGDDNFIARLYSADDGSYVDLLANHIGATSGSVSIRESGTFYLDITGDGFWEIEIGDSAATGESSSNLSEYCSQIFEFGPGRLWNPLTDASDNRAGKPAVLLTGSNKTGLTSMFLRDIAGNIVCDALTFKAASIPGVNGGADHYFAGWIGACDLTAEQMAEIAYANAGSRTLFMEWKNGSCLRIPEPTGRYGNI